MLIADLEMCIRDRTLIAILSGLFAVPNIIDKIRRGGSQSKTYDIIAMSKDDHLTMKEFLRLKWIILKSSIIGIVVGAVPGAGAGIASFISYNEAKRTSKTVSYTHLMGEPFAAINVQPSAFTGRQLSPHHFLFRFRI